MNALKEVGLSPQEYLDIKQQFGRETKLGQGKGTCFGSLVWCCKTSKPCPLRDMTLNQIGMSHDEYLTLKKELSEVILGAKNPEKLSENTKALIESFKISEEEAKQVLEDSHNDLRVAMKSLKMKELEE